ncbi:hypothetical protein TRFO_41690 [Tritrichomonas foetus]|uniref:Glycosyltransferase 2-like domain-containing protein n=1 Tax=Tritrichomonas foetus TaxID=1144522 RepID=A0A1J4KZC4_9EUKA|nr:hypothetical protein TRFO_41690 [Tritrichomonas foetus]|eukprot:OHT16609.1 hypothetical protein TRFO_41690 [Tritrichomonas foetus]
MGEPVGDFIILLTFILLLISFAISVFLRFVDRKTWFDHFYIKKNETFRNMVIYHNRNDVDEKYFPSLFKESYLKLSVIIPFYGKGFNILKTFPAISEYFQNQSQNINDFTYEIIVINDNCIDSLDLEYLQSQNNTRVISLKETMGIGFTIQIGCLAGNGQYLLILQQNSNLEFISHLISHIPKEKGNFHEFSFLSANGANKNFIQKLLERRKTIPTIYDINFDNFILSQSVARVVIPNIHFSNQLAFNYELLFLVNAYKNVKTRINEILLGFYIHPKPNWESYWSLFIFLFGNLMELFSYSVKVPPEEHTMFI